MRSPNARRRREIDTWSALRAPSGGSSSQSRSIKASVVTSWFALTRRCASSNRWRRPPVTSGPSGPITSTGPSTRNSIRAAYASVRATCPTGRCDVRHMSAACQRPVTAMQGTRRTVRSWTRTARPSAPCRSRSPSSRWCRSVGHSPAPPARRSPAVRGSCSSPRNRPRGAPRVGGQAIPGRRAAAPCGSGRVPHRLRWVPRQRGLPGQRPDRPLRATGDGVGSGADRPPRARARLVRRTPDGRGAGPVHAEPPHHELERIDGRLEAAWLRAGGRDHRMGSRRRDASTRSSTERTIRTHSPPGSAS